MELDWPTPISCPPSLEWHQCTAWHTPGSKAVEGGKAPLSGGYATEGRIQVLAGLAPTSQTVGSLFGVIYEKAEHSS